MAEIGLIIGLIGSGLQTMASIQQGKAQAAALEFEAKQREKQGAEELAASQREAMDKRRQGDEVLSRQVALSAASGGSATDASILDIYEDTATRAEYGAQVATYGGQSRKAGHLDAAAAARMKAAAAKKAGLMDGLASAISGFGSFVKGSPT